MPAEHRRTADAERVASALAKDAETVFKVKAAEEKREIEEAEKRRKQEGEVQPQNEKKMQREPPPKKAKDEQRKISKAASDLAKQLAKVTEAQQKLADAKANSLPNEKKNEPTPPPATNDHALRSWN